MNPSNLLAEEYLWQLSRSLAGGLSNPRLVHENVAKWISHAPKFPEVRFCKGCVLPIVDMVTTEFFNSKLGLSASAANAALRCEGASTLSGIYTPGENQVGYSGITWGTNYQGITKGGKAGRYRPCPDFGVIHAGPPSLNVLGEVKFAAKAVKRDRLLAGIRKDMDYYMGLSREPELGWHYEVGIGVAYGAMNGGEARIEVITDDWAEKNYFVVLFSDGS